MKTMRKMIVLAFVLIPIYFLTAQVPPHPNNGGGPGGGNIPVGGGAPIGGGIIILLALAAGYGAQKVYDMRRKAQKE